MSADLETLYAAESTSSAFSSTHSTPPWKLSISASSRNMGRSLSNATAAVEATLATAAPSASLVINCSVRYRGPRKFTLITLVPGKKPEIPTQLNTACNGPAITSTAESIEARTDTAESMY